MKKIFYLLIAFLFVINIHAQTKVYTKGGVLYMIDTQTTTQYEGIARNVLVVRSLTSSTDFYFKNVNGWMDAWFLTIGDIQKENGDVYSIDEFILFYENSTNSATPTDYYLKVAQGEVLDESIINKFGRNAVVGTSLVPVCLNGNYRTPISAQTLTMESSDADDTLLGVGAQKIVIQGLDGNFDIQTEEIEMDGLTPVTLANTYTRVFRMYVSQSGVYATQIQGSHEGELILKESPSGDEWARISVEGLFGIGQTQIGAYTIPRGYTGYLLGKVVTVESGKPASLYFFKRENSNDVATPFTGTMRLFEENNGLEAPFNLIFKAPLQELSEMTDVGFLAKVTSLPTASISVDFQILLKKN